MPLTREQKDEINESNRDQVTRALQFMAGAKNVGSHVDNPDIRELEAMLRARLAQLDHIEEMQKVSAIIEGTLAIINEADLNPDAGPIIKT